MWVLPNLGSLELYFAKQDAWLAAGGKCNPFYGPNIRQSESQRWGKVCQFQSGLTSTHSSVGQPNPKTWDRCSRCNKPGTTLHLLCFSSLHVASTYGPSGQIRLLPLASAIFMSVTNVLHYVSTVAIRYTQIADSAHRPTLAGDDELPCTSTRPGHCLFRSPYFFRSTQFFRRACFFNRYLVFTIRDKLLRFSLSAGSSLNNRYVDAHSRIPILELCQNVIKNARHLFAFYFRGQKWHRKFAQGRERFYRCRFIINHFRDGFEWRILTTSGAAKNSEYCGKSLKLNICLALYSSLTRIFPNHSYEVHHHDNGLVFIKCGSKLHEI